MQLAIYHCSIKTISRGKGQSAIAAAAYRAGEKITSEYDGRTSDYTRKGGIVHTEIILPNNAPAEYQDRAILWNAVEKIEKAKNSQLAREIQLALPIELSYMQNVNLVREYVRKNFTDKGMCADIAIHDNKDGNPHAHIMLTMRPFNENRTWGAKFKKVYHLDESGNKIYNPENRTYKYTKENSVDWDNRDKAEEWRAAWADTANRYLEMANHTERVDHRSYARQGKAEIPTIHLGVAAHQMEQRGIQTERGNINRAIQFANQKLRNLKIKITELKSDIETLLSEKITPPVTQTQPQEITPPPITAQPNQTPEPLTGFAAILAKHQAKADGTYPTTPPPQPTQPPPRTTQIQQGQTTTDEPKPLTGYAAILAKHQAKASGTHPTTLPPQPTQPPPLPTAELNILDMLKNMLSDPQAKTKVQRITTLSVVKSAVEFLEQYNITTLSKLQKTLANTETKFDEVNEKTKSVEERLKKLNPLIKQADLYLQHREINRLYKQQKPKHKDKFYETHRTELTLYQAAEHYLQSNLDGKTLNTKAWKKEAAELTAERDKLTHDYKGLKEGVRQIGLVRRSVEHILDNTEKMEQPQQQRQHDMER